MRVLVLLCGLCCGLVLRAQQTIDSVHVFKRIPPGAYTSASANALAWQLHKIDAPHRSLRGADIVTVAQVFAEYKPARHDSGPIPGLSHVAMVFYGGRPVAFGVTADLDRVINFTARREYHISTLSEHVRVRALLSQLAVD